MEIYGYGYRSKCSYFLDELSVEIDIESLYKSVVGKVCATAHWGAVKNFRSILDIFLDQMDSVADTIKCWPLEPEVVGSILDDA